MCSVRKLALRLFGIVLPMLLVVSLFPALAFAESGRDGSDATYVAFTSDVHNASSSKTGGSAVRLNNWINNVSSAVGSSFDNMVFCGDTGTANTSTNNFWNFVQVVMDLVSANDNVSGDGVFINGNHEFKEGAQSSSNTNAAAQRVKNIGYVAEGSDYLIYVFGARSQSQGFNSSDITALGNWLNSTPAGKPIFVVSHFPLHKNGSRDSENKASVISTLNNYADKHEIYFLWGHNHTDSDSKYDEVITGTLDGKAIGFAYLAAGCMSDSEYSSGSAYVKGKGLVAKIQDGTVTSLTYYAENAKVVYSFEPEYSDKPGVDPGCSHSGGIATCKDKAVCTKCGERYGNLNASNHSGGTEVRDAVAATCGKSGYSGDTYCLGCGAKTASGKTVAATGNHAGGTATCASKAKCSTCRAEYGQLSPSNHAGGTEIRNDEDPTCSEDGYTGDIWCLGCNTKISSGRVLPATGDHVDADGDWESNPAQHYRTCGCGETFDYANHSGGTATCASKAKCATCGVEYGSLSASNHVGGTEVRDAVAATCGKSGYSGDTYCLGCGVKVESGEVVVPTGIHDYENGICTVCDAEDPNYKPAHTHAGGGATCCAKAVCSACGELYGDFDASNHAGGTEARDASAATCGEAGYTGDAWCLGCDTMIASGRVLPATGDHDFIHGVCTVCDAEDPNYKTIDGLTAKVELATYTGSTQQPVLTIVYEGTTLIAGEDYIVTSEAKTNAGTYMFTVVGTGAYEGEITGEWAIAPAGITAAEGLVLADKFAFTGNPIEPSLFLSFNGQALVMGTDYTVTYANNVNPGLATAIVAGIGNFAGTADVSFTILQKAHWEEGPRGWKYRNPDGSYSADCWQEIDGARYYFGSDGYMQTGWLKDANEWYYLKASGAMACSEWEEVSGSWYHFADDGVMETGWFMDANSWYYLKASGAMACSEWEEVSGSWYHFAASGVMQTGWLAEADSWYYLKASGAMAESEWEEVSGAWYYFNGSGIMQASKWIGDYYVLASGKMATSQWVGSYYVGADGKWVPNYKG